MKTKCIIIEDEPLAQDVIETYLTGITEIELCAKFDNTIKAFQYLQKNKIDLMFLDIQMPQLSGIDFLKTLRNAPKVIFTTAFRDYAVEGFELNVIDYLLKPISLERFLKAIDKYYQTISTQIPLSAPQSSDAASPRYIYIQSNRKQIKVVLDDILYLESLKDYVMIYTKDQKIMTKNTLSYFEESLSEELFLRIHRSYIISISKINSVTKTSIEIGKRELPIGKQYKNSVSASLGTKI
jgi:DNA-binding LytR/AlgR family response regulator